MPSDDRYRFGPLVEDGGTRFQLWSPGARRVELILERGGDEGGGEPRRLRMREGDDGFFSRAVEGAGPGTHYRFSRNGGRALPDPASRWQPRGVDGPSEVLADSAREHSWGGRPIEQWVIYELHVGAFTPEGTYQGVEQRLDHLESLGVTALELMPLATFGGERNWGYDGVLHFAPHHGYGSPASLRSLIDACHAREIAVVLDVVTNHFGPEGNAMWTLAPRFFRRDHGTAWGAGLRWADEPVLRYFDELVRHSIERYDVDGFRLDAFHAVPREARARHLRRMVAAVGAARPEPRPTLVLLESHANQGGLLARHEPAIQVAQLNFDIQRATHAHLTGEGHGEYGDFTADPVAELARCLDGGFAFARRHSRHYGRLLGDGTPPPDWNAIVNFIQNHDTVGNRYLGERLDRLVSGRRLRAATAMLLLHPGLPFLFMGQEWGAQSPFLFFIDHSAGLNRRVAHARTAGFRELSGGDHRGSKPPPPDDPATLERSTLRWSELQEDHSQRRLAFLRELLAVRAKWVGAMTRDLRSTRARRSGDALLVEVPARQGGAGFLLVCNLVDQPLRLAQQSDIIYTTASAANIGEVAEWQVELRRVTSSDRGAP